MASLEDLEAVAPAVLNHRVITNFAAESQGMTSKKIIQKLIGEMADAGLRCFRPPRARRAVRVHCARGLAASGPLFEFPQSA